MRERDNLIGKYITLAILLFAMLVGCNSNNSQDGQINYQELAPLKVDLIKEIAGDDSYLPGQLRDLVIISDSTTLVSDAGTNTIEQFTTEGEHIATIAEAGRGPGELSNLFTIYKGTEDTLFVRNRINTERIDSYTRGPDGIYQYRHSWAPDEAGDRYVSVEGLRGRSAFFARASLTSQDFQKAVENYERHTHTPLAIVDKHEKIIRDSLHILKSPKPVAEFSPGSMYVIGMPPYQRTDRFIVLQDGQYAIARPDSATLYFYGVNHELQNRISLNIKERPVTDEDLEFLLDQKNLEGDDRKKMEARVPEVKPPFLNAWITDTHIWLHTDLGKTWKEMVVLSREGDPLGKFHLPFVDEIQEVRGNRLYALHKNSETGHSIKIYKVEL